MFQPRGNISRLSQWVTSVILMAATDQSDSSMYVNLTSFVYTDSNNSLAIFRPCTSSQEYDIVCDTVYHILKAPQQTYFSLFHTLILIERFFAAYQLPELVGQTVDSGALQRIITVLYIIVLDALNCALPLEEQYVSPILVFVRFLIDCLRRMHLAHCNDPAPLLEYKERLVDAVSSAENGLEIGYEEWNSYVSNLKHIYRKIPVPGGMLEEIHTAYIAEIFLHHVTVTSTRGNQPLSELDPSLWPSAAAPLNASFLDLPSSYARDPVDDDVVWVTPLPSVFFPCDVGGPLNPDDFMLHPPSIIPVSRRLLKALAELPPPAPWCPAADPIVEVGRKTGRYIAPGADRYN